MLRKIRVMHVLYYLSVGGLEEVVLNLMKTLDRSYYEPFLACLRETGSLRSEFEKCGVQVFEFNRGDGLDLGLPFALAKVLRKNEIDILHTHDLGPYLYGAVAAKLAGVPMLIHTEHSYLSQNTRLLRFAEKVLSIFTKTIISDSNDVTRYLIDVQHISPRKIVTIYNGIDTDRFQMRKNGVEVKKKLGLSEKSQVIGTVGRLVPVKDQRTLVSAFKNVLAEQANTHLLIVGDGPLRAELEQFTHELGIADRVHLLGNRRDVDELLQIFDMFVLPSLSEGLSLSLIEAMASGKPVIATGVGGNVEIIHSSKVGSLVSVGDVQQLSKAMLWLLNNPAEAEQIGVAARKRVVDRFSLKTMARYYEQVYVAHLN